MLTDIFMQLVSKGMLMAALTAPSTLTMTSSNITLAPLLMVTCTATPTSFAGDPSPRMASA